MRGIALICALLIPLAAEQLPIRAYSSADGLPHNRVFEIFPDSRAFIWFGTAEGLSRFDGQRFTNFGVADGLPHQLISKVLQSRAGDYWVGTLGGLARLVPTGRQAFEAFVPSDTQGRIIDSLLEGRDGTIWAGTEHGLYRVVLGGAGKWRMELASLVTARPASINGLAEDTAGRLWIGTASGLFRRLPDGGTECFGSREQLASLIVNVLLADRSGRLWVGTRTGLYRLVEQPALGTPGVERHFTTADGLGHNDIKSLLQTADGAMWVGTVRNGLTRLTWSGSAFQARMFTVQNGLVDDAVFVLASDEAGNIWAGTDSGGAFRIAPDGLVRYTAADGLPSLRVDSAFETPSGLVCATGEGRAVACFDGRRFQSVMPKYRSKEPSWAWSQVMLQDRAGEWWVAMNEGLERFPAVRFEELAQTPLKKRYHLPTYDTSVLRVFEDSRGDIWALYATSAIYRWDRASDRFMPCRPSGPSIITAGAIGEDHAGNVWVGVSGEEGTVPPGSSRSGVLRYRNRTFEPLSATEDVHLGGVRALLCDRMGRLWIASSHGLGRVDNPGADRPTIETYTTAQGLLSDGITCLTDDQWGRIYACTNKGVDRLDPATGAIRHYSNALGFPLGALSGATRDHSNRLWFAGARGLLLLKPAPDQPSAPRRLLFTSLDIAGRPRVLSRLGQDRVIGVELPRDQNQLRIGFVAPGPDNGEPLSYQYSLNGSKWSAPATEQTVDLVGLRPGPYDFSVRALSPIPGPAAQLAFSIAPPLWQRWWFMAAAVALLVLAAYAIHRLLVAQHLAVERMRSRIATDLHDDIGSSLSQIAIMSELAQRGGSGSTVSEIASLSRDLVDAMSDIVWAINPKHDRVSNLLHRVRRFAEDTLEAQSIDLQFRTTGFGSDIHAPADVRRQVFLIFKEAITNVARHSGARNAIVMIDLLDGTLRLSITDDGRGFDPRDASDGNGLVNMRERARNLGGSVEFIARPGQGTKVLAAIPLARRARRRPDKLTGDSG